MASTIPRFFGRHTLTTDEINFTIDDAGGADAVALTVGDYYLESYTAEGTNQLLEHMAAQINTVGGYGSATCTFSASTGKVTVALGTGGNVDIAWTDSDLQTLLGFTGSQTGAESYTATNPPKFVWSPSRAPTNYPVEQSQFWAPRSTSMVGRSKDGTSFSVEGNLIYDAFITFSNLVEADIIIPSSGSVNKEFQQFFEDVIHKGQPIRVYVDRSIKTAANVKTAMVSTEEGEPLGSFNDFAVRHIRSYNGLWDIELLLNKFI